MYISKSVIVGILFAAIGLVGGWMLHGSANEVASATAPLTTVLQDVPAATGPAPLGLAFTGDSRMNAPWTAVGTPAISIPIPVTAGLPLAARK